MFIICFTNSNVDERSCLVSLFGLSVALFSTVFYFCKVTDLASPLFLFFSSCLSCSSFAALVSALLSRSFACLSAVLGWSISSQAPASFPSSVYPLLLFHPSLWSPSLSLSTFRSNTRVWRHSADPVPKPTPTQSSCLSSQGHQGPSAFSKNHVFS